MRSTHDNLKSGAIKKLTNEVYGEVKFDPAVWPNMYGIILLAQDSAPYDAKQLVPEIGHADFPVFVFSLKDVALLTRRFDTAADFVNFIELRTDIGARESFLVNDEEQNLLKDDSLCSRHLWLSNAADHEEDSRSDRRGLSTDGHRRATQFSRVSVQPVVDDMISRAHDLDPNLPWNDGRRVSVAADIARFLGWLTRYRRIKLGKRILDMCVRSAEDGKGHWFSHFQKSRGTAPVYLVSNQSREERKKYLEFLVTYAHFKYGVAQSFGVATDVGVSGRSYDFMLTRKQLTPEAIKFLRTFDDPFGNSSNELL